MSIDSKIKPNRFSNECFHSFLLKFERDSHKKASHKFIRFMAKLIMKHSKHSKKYKLRLLKILNDFASNSDTQKIKKMQKFVKEL